MQSNELAKINMLENYFQRLPRFIQNHSQAVAYYTEMLMKQLVILQEEMTYLPPAFLPKVGLLGRYHDIGKVGITNEIWEATAPLKPMEKKLVQMHPIIGAYIVQEELKPLLSIVMSADISVCLAQSCACHHEHWNGKGYPFGKTAAELNEPERIMACIDIYQALTESRPYKQGFSHEKTCDILDDMADKGFIDAGIAQKIRVCFQNTTI